MTPKPKVRTCLWFEKHAREAAEFYVSLLPDSFVETATAVNGERPATVVEFTLAGTPYMLLEAGPDLRQSPATSIVVKTADQAETDRLWRALTADGGAESMCGWLVDRFGMSWQITPQRLLELVLGDDRDGAKRAMAAMMTMRKIDIAAIEAAFVDA